MSPDGRRAVFSLTKYNLKTDKGNADLQLIELPGGKTTPLTQHARQRHSASLEPGWPQYCFWCLNGVMSKTSCLYCRCLAEKQKNITQLPVAVSSPVWLPDGKQILFVAEVPAGFDGDFQKLAAAKAAEKDNKVSAKVTENRMYRFWDHWLTNDTYPQFFTVRKVDTRCDPPSNAGLENADEFKRRARV